MQHLYDKSDVPFSKVDYEKPTKKELPMNKVKNQGKESFFYVMYTKISLYFMNNKFGSHGEVFGIIRIPYFLAGLTVSFSALF